MSELRTLRIHDLPFVYRMIGQGISFDSQLNLTVGNDALHQAMLTGRGVVQPYILRMGSENGLAVLHLPGKRQFARLAYVAPSIANGASDSLWFTALDGLTEAAGEQGAVNLIAEVGDDTDEYELLRRANFAPYARQEIWVRPAARLESMKSRELRAATIADEPAIMSLYGSLVPTLLKHVEPPPTTADETLVVDGSNGLKGIVTIYRGVHAVIVEIYLQPEAAYCAKTTLTETLHRVRADLRPVYVRLRASAGSYVSALEPIGFELLESQVILIRHTAVRIKQASFKKVSVIDHGIALPTPIVDVAKQDLAPGFFPADLRGLPL